MWDEAKTVPEYLGSRGHDIVRRPHDGLYRRRSVSDAGARREADQPDESSRRVAGRTPPRGRRSALAKAPVLVTPTLRFEVPRKCGPPESPKQVPPSPVAVVFSWKWMKPGPSELNRSVVDFRVVSSEHE
jgi:hypothetical protein